MDFDDAQDIDIAEIDKAVRTQIQSIFKKPVLDMTKLSAKSNQLIDSCVKAFQMFNKPYKYTVTCIIQQRTGAGCVTAAACYWDTMKDNLTHVKWENEQVTVIVTVFAMAIDPYEQHKLPFNNGEEEEAMDGPEA
jgi:dynein light chain Tctex-type 1